MIISFDLDGVLMLTRYDDPAMLEPAPPFPWNKLYRKDPLRKGTVELIHALKDRGFDVWIYTSSGRTEKYLKRLFAAYGLRFDDIVNMQRHQKDIQEGRSKKYPAKMPCRYHISLHVDDEETVVQYGKDYGFNVFLLKNDNKNWVQDIIECAETIDRREKKQYGT